MSWSWDIAAFNTGGVKLFAPHSICFAYEESALSIDWIVEQVGPRVRIEPYPCRETNFACHQICKEVYIEMI